MDILQESPPKEEESMAQKSTSSPKDNATLDLPPGTLPPQLLTLLQTIIATLRTSFYTSPPHTSQRLAELLLHPRSHYRTLPSYLRALDRIVSVASPASIFPLKNLNVTPTGTNGAMLNGTCSPSPDPADDADFIGGAELTEIPWAPKPVMTEAGAEGSHTTTNNAPANASDLRTESTSLIDGPNGPGGVETVTVANGVTSSSSSTTTPREDSTPSTPTISSATVTGNSTPQHGITQGELLRQEQEAGIVPVPSPAHSSQGGGSSNRVTRSSAAASAAASRAVGITPDVSDDLLPGETAHPLEEETVHARGPGVIGMEDMGPQAPGSGLEGGIDVEGTLGRRGESITQPTDTVETSSQGTGATQELDGMILEEEGGIEEERENDKVSAEADTEKHDEEKGKLEDGDVMVMDADGVPEGKEGKAVEEGLGPNAVDTTNL